MTVDQVTIVMNRTVETVHLNKVRSLLLKAMIVLPYLPMHGFNKDLMLMHCREARYLSVCQEAGKYVLLNPRGIYCTKNAL